MMPDRMMNGILFDHTRVSRIGLPEAVFCEGKSRDALIALIMEHGAKSQHPALFTRLNENIFHGLPDDVKALISYHHLSQVAFAGTKERVPYGKVGIVSAGTADGRTTWEAAKTLEYLGVNISVFEDNGVAGLWRLTSHIEAINACDVLIVVAGLDAALASVLGGLTPKPLIAVPTSIGYGVARGGESALHSMLLSCSPGVPVMNIDNGYGAACAAARIINLMNTVHANRP